MRRQPGRDRGCLCQISQKGQFIPDFVPSAAELWNKRVKLSKLPYSSKQIPDERISCIWFIEAVWCPQSILTI